MSLTIQASTAFTADAQFPPSLTGLTGTVGVAIHDSQNNVILARTTAGISEDPAGSAGYLKTFSSSTLTSLGYYRLIWDTGGATPEYAIEDVLVATTAAGALVSAPSGSDLCTVADVRQAMEITDSGDTSRDAVTQTLITEASLAIMAYTDREFAPQSSSVTRRFRVERVPGAFIPLAPYDLRTADTVHLNPESSSPVALTQYTDFMLEPVQGRSNTYKGLRLAPAAPIFSTVAVKFGYGLLDITGEWGFGAIPADVKRACVEAVRAWLDKAVQAYGMRDVEDLPSGYLPAPDGAYGLPPSSIRLLLPWRNWTP